MKIETVSVGAFDVNCYLVGSDGRALVIDPGDDPAAIRAILDKHGWRVAAYLLTHGHMDHISALYDLHGQAPAPVGIHPADSRWAFSPANAFPPYYPEPRRPAGALRELTDGSRWNDAGLSYEIIATPGHTPGCVCIHFPGKQALFTGDTLFAGTVGRTDLPGGNARTLTESLKKIAVLPPATVVYPGHGPASTIGAEKHSNFYMSSLRA